MDNDNKEKRRQFLQNKLKKYGLKVEIDDLLNNPLIDSKRLLEDGIIEMSLDHLLKAGYRISPEGDIIAPLMSLKEVSLEMGWNIKAASVYKSRGNTRRGVKFPEPAIYIAGVSYWTDSQIKKMSGKDKLLVEESRQSDKE